MGVDSHICIKDNLAFETFSNCLQPQIRLFITNTKRTDQLIVSFLKLTSIFFSIFLTNTFVVS